MTLLSRRVPLSSCIFAARFAERTPDDLSARLERIRSFYAPTGLRHLSVVRPADNLVVGQVAAHETALAPDAGTLIWGEALPAGLDGADAALRELRAIAGMTAAFAWRGGRVAAVNGASGPATLYECGSVVSTHAVAAALLARVPLELDRTAVAEFTAMDFAGGERTLLQHVKAVAPATRITLHPEGLRREVYWPARERWELVPETEAYAAAERELLATLAERTRGARVGLPLTAGLDSTVAAAALAADGVAAAAFTWGVEDWPDSVGARATAHRFGFTHTTTGFEPLSSDDCRADLDQEVRWNDGITALATARRSWPDGAGAFVAGMGGECGRAFYYDAWSALFVPRPGDDRLLVALGGDGRLRAADEEVRGRLAQSLREWIEAARATGVNDWRVLDVLYAEQRVRRWGRSQVPRLDADIVPLFTPQPIVRALVSLPLEERLTDGFHRRFLTSRGIEPLTKAADIPRFSALSWFARRRLHTVRPRRPQPYDDPVDLLVASVWAEKAELADWLRDEVCAHPAISESLGGSWGGVTWGAFSAGRVRSTERLMRAAGVVAFASAIDAA